MHSYSWQLRPSKTVGINVRKLHHGYVLSKTRTQIRKLGEYNVQVVSLTNLFNSVSGQLTIPVQVNIQGRL